MNEWLGAGVQKAALEVAVVVQLITVFFFAFAGKWLYCVGEDGVMYVFDAVGGQLESVLQVRPITRHALLIQILQNVAFAEQRHTMIGRRRKGCYCCCTPST